MRQPENITISDQEASEISKADAEKVRSTSYSWGLFIDIMHDEAKINPVAIDNFENGGVVHFYTAAAGISYKIITANNFFAEYGIGITQSSIFGNSFDQRSFAASTDWFFKIGIGYRLYLTDTTAINIGVDLVGQYNSYHKTGNGNYTKFEHSGIYPYAGISF